MLTKINGNVFQIVEVWLNKSVWAIDPETGKYIKCHQCKRPLEYQGIEEENITDNNGIKCDIVLVACPKGHMKLSSAILK